MFQKIYESAWHHPASFWLVGAVFLSWLVLTGAGRPAPTRAGRALWVGVVLFQLQIALDAWLTGALSPLVVGALAQALAIAFVVLGDLRFLLLFELIRRPRAPAVGAAVALGLSLVVPLLSLVAKAAWPGNARALFLTYELMFATLAITLRVGVLPRAAATLPPAHHAWLRRLTDFELCQYLLWAGADVLILAGADAGYGLRLVPNTLYYAVFLPFAYATAPRELRP